LIDSSTPGFSEFNPATIPFQLNVIRDIRTFDYSLGTPEILLSGAVGSAKSILMAHIGVTHCLDNPGARILLGRRSMPSLRDTLLKVIIDHIGEIPHSHNKHRGIISFANKSEMIPYSWADTNYEKVRSLELSAAILEELSENDDMVYYKEIFARVGRLSHVKEKFVIGATNPDDPAHPLYKYFIASDNPMRWVYYSKTLDNPYLPETYISQLEEMYDPKMALRMLEGQWISVSEESLYYGYDREHNYVNSEYKVDPAYPIHWCHDFNIGHGKPMSSCFFQYINGIFHIFAEVIVEGSRTETICEESANRGLLDYNAQYIINGDAMGRYKGSSQSRHSDYEIIKIFLDTYEVKDDSGKKRYPRYEVKVTKANPKLRLRHNLVNGQLHNTKGQRRVLVYKGCDTVDEGFRLTKLKKGAEYLEDDSKYYQHVTTAFGYGLVRTLKETKKRQVQMLSRSR